MTPTATARTSSRCSARSSGSTPGRRRGKPYRIPASNPFATGDGADEIYAYGLRNPWRFSFDRMTKDLVIADVGQNVIEEVNFLPSGTPGGANFGWSSWEGTTPAKLVSAAG